jgi:hypothetical protein
MLTIKVSEAYLSFLNPLNLFIEFIPTEMLLKRLCQLIFVMSISARYRTPKWGKTSRNILVASTLL